MRIEGAAWVFGDDIDTDVLAPGYAMKLAPEELARHCLEAVDPDFATSVRQGDVLVAGRNFGLGSSREQAAVSLKILGIGAVLAESFARIFYRNAMNVGLPAIVFPAASEVRKGERVTAEPARGRVVTGERAYAVEPVPAHLMDMLRAGGLMAQLERRFGGLDDR